MTESGRRVSCSGCGEPLSIECVGERPTGAKCPHCGSSAQTVSLDFESHVSVFDFVKLRSKNPALTGKDKHPTEYQAGHELRRSTGEMVYKERLIDRRRKKYRELVKTLDGTVLRDVTEPLGQHRGHGTAKREKP
jgi:hypothetical protein